MLTSLLEWSYAVQAGVRPGGRRPAGPQNRARDIRLRRARGDPPPVPVMTGLNPSSSNGARPRPALLVAGPDPAPDQGMHPALSQAGDRRGVDLGAAERAATEFLAALGIDLDREERRATPARMVRAYAELLAAQPFRLTTFPNDEGYDELVLARAIPFRTLCEHHMLLFSGVAHVGYLPGERILGLSKLARLVEHFAARPQTQERLTMQVARCLEANLRPRGAGVVLEAG